MAQEELRLRICEMLVETGPSVSVTTWTNVFAFGVGIFTPSPEIQLFSLGNAVAVLFDALYQVLDSKDQQNQLTIYAALMVLVGRREIAAEAEDSEEEKEDLKAGSKRKRLRDIMSRYSCTSDRSQFQGGARLLEISRLANCRRSCDATLRRLPDPGRSRYNGDESRTPPRASGPQRFAHRAGSVKLWTRF